MDQRFFMSRSFKEAAYEILKNEQRPLAPDEIASKALHHKLINTSGKTPERSMGAQLYVDIRDNQNSPFVQLGKNRFGLREWDISVIQEEIKKTEKEKEEIPTLKRSIVGDPINFKGLIYSPLNESGVIFLFGKIQDTLGINIETIQASYPDAKGRRKTSKGWEDIWIEFEYRSSQFKLHNHDPRDCDLIVCWEHDWKECPLEV